MHGDNADGIIYFTISQFALFVASMETEVWPSQKYFT